MSEIQIFLCQARFSTSQIWINDLMSLFCPVKDDRHIVVIIIITVIIFHNEV